MAGASSITGYSLYPAFSDYGGYAGQSSTTSGVGGVGAYHHLHRGRASGTQRGAGQNPPPSSQTSDLVDLRNGTGDLAAAMIFSPPAAGGQGWMTTGSIPALAAWRGSPRSPGKPSDAPGQFLDTLA